MVQASNTIPLRSRVGSGFQRDSLIEVNAKNRHGGRNAAVKIGQIPLWTKHLGQEQRGRELGNFYFFVHQPLVRLIRPRQLK